MMAHPMQHYGDRKKPRDKDILALKNHIAQQDYVIKSLKLQLKEAKRAVGEETP